MGSKLAFLKTFLVDFFPLSVQVANSSQCSSGKGTLECGECVCHSGRYGRLCECSGDTAKVYSYFVFFLTFLVISSLVQVANSSQCSSGNGTLECGECVCHPGRYGRLCECSGDTAKTDLDNVDACTG